ncbi:UvrD-helicase domain-containing protein [Clostridium sp.]|uniref:UvrD-helicase domain-containing protein n=1 Tax=Clostridium sp. TaxID=1506 RepID=UPI002FC79A6A
MKLTKQQQEIVDYSGNLAVKANAGTGKTQTMVCKIEKEIKENNSHKVIAAITFTIKATQEIKSRINLDLQEHFVGTNNSFVIEEIIRPFFYDIYDYDMNKEINTDYDIEFLSFEEAVDNIISNGLIGSYEDKNKNFVFQLALHILKLSRACQKYISSKFFKIYVDEYQDCDIDMHNLFMYLCNDLKIEFFIVGDDKQSIYGFKGSSPEYINSIIKDNNFKYLCINKNQRTCKQIENYSNILFDKTISLYEEIDNQNNIFLIKTNKLNWVKDVKQYINMDEKLALLRFRKVDAEEGANQLSNNGIECSYISQTPVSTITTKTAWIYNYIAMYIIKNKFSIYDFLAGAPQNCIERDNTIKNLKDKLNILKESFRDLTKDEFAELVNEVFSILNQDLDEKNFEKLYETVINDIYYNIYNLDSIDRISITFHASKGLEYEQIIVFANDYNLTDIESRYNHYVAVTRAKSKLIIVYCGEEFHATIFKKNFCKIIKNNNLDIGKVLTIIK